MSRANGIRITETALSIFGENHAPFLVMEPLRREDGKFPEAIIVATQDPGGLVPRALMLPHQLYTDKTAAILRESGAKNLWVFPVYESSAWTQIEERHWVGDAPTSLHGNGASSFAATTPNRSEVTCKLCLYHLDRIEAEEQTNRTDDES